MRISCWLLQPIFVGALLLGCGGGQPSSTTGPIISSGHEPPPGTPYSQREHYQHQGHLLANGFAAERASWRAAVAAPAPSVRAAACALLAEEPVPEDRTALEPAASDADALVRAWAALALARLGEARARQTLLELSSAPASALEPAPLVAAAALLRLGDRAGAQALEVAMASDELRLEATRWLIDLARLDAALAVPLYARALRAPAQEVRSLALSQLEELRPQTARPMLEELLGDPTAAAGERERAQQLLATLPR